jgi:hypothetical protein
MFRRAAWRRQDAYLAAVARQDSIAVSPIPRQGRARVRAGMPNEDAKAETMRAEIGRLRRLQDFMSFFL